MRHSSGESGPSWVLGVDSGGSGVRVALAPADALTASTGSAERTVAPATVDAAVTPATVDASAATVAAADRPAVTGPRGIDAASLLERVLPLVEGLMAAAGARRIAAACVGAAGMATLGDDLRDRLPDALADAFGVRRLALAGDAVTAYAGALGLRPGVVVAAGTGMIALGTSAEGGDHGGDHSGDHQGAGGGWRRADGWGHLLGDAGGGAWIGRAGLDAAMRAHDGRAGGSPALLAAAERQFGPLDAMPGRLYPRPDRAAVLASFAPQVARHAGDDPVAAGILRQAARHILESAAAVRPGTGPVDVALAGGLFRTGEPLLGPLRELAAELLPGATLVPAAGDPLDGAVLIAGAAHHGRLTLPHDPGLLTVSDRPGD